METIDITCTYELRFEAKFEPETGLLFLGTYATNSDGQWSMTSDALIESRPELDEYTSSMVGVLRGWLEHWSPALQAF